MGNGLPVGVQGGFYRTFYTKVEERGSEVLGFSLV